MGLSRRPGDPRATRRRPNAASGRHPPGRPRAGSRTHRHPDAGRAGVAWRDHLGWFRSVTERADGDGLRPARFFRRRIETVPDGARETFARHRRSAAIRASPLPPLNRSSPMPGKNSDTRYTKDHEWVRLDGDIVTVGITDYAQQQLGELVFIELPELERDVAASEACAVVESVKAASDIYAPLAGKVAEINETIVEDPEIVNSDAEGEGWFFRLEIDDPATFEELMDQDAY